LQNYLEIQPEQVKGAIATLSMLSPVSENPDKIFLYPDKVQPQSLEKSRD
jgi:integrase/recombinase XerD